MRIKLIIAVLFALLAATTLAQTTGVAPIEDSVLGAWVKAHGVYAFAGASLAGVLCNYASMRYNDLTSVTLLEYLFKHQPGRSVASAFVIAGSIWAAASTDLIVGASATNIIVLGWGVGFGIDGMVNGNGGKT